MTVQDDLRTRESARRQAEMKLEASLAEETERSRKSNDELGRIQLQFTDMAEQCRLASAARDQGALEVKRLCEEKEKLASTLEEERGVTAERESLAEREKELLAAVRKLECAEEAVEEELTACTVCLCFETTTVVVTEDAS